MTSRCGQSSSLIVCFQWQRLRFPPPMSGDRWAQCQPQPQPHAFSQDRVSDNTIIPSFELAIAGTFSDHLFPWATCGCWEMDQHTSGSGDVQYLGTHRCATTPDVTGRSETTSLDLCERCAAIKFEDSFYHGFFHTFPRPYALNLGNLTEHASCALCRFLYSMRCFEGELQLEHLYGDPIDHSNPDEYHLCVFPLAENSEYFLDASYTSTCITSTVLCVLPGLVKDPDVIGHWNPTPIRNKHWILPQLYQQTFFGPGPIRMSALPVSATAINYSLLRAWCQQCDAHHSSCREAEHTQNDSGIPRICSVTRCIDVHKRQIIPIKPSDRYFALSYVWGKQVAPRGLNATARETWLVMPVFLGRQITVWARFISTNRKP